MSQRPTSAADTVPSRSSQYSNWTDDLNCQSNTRQSVQPLQEVERTELQPYSDQTNEEFPWLSQEFKPLQIPNIRTRSSSGLDLEHQGLDRGNSRRSQRAVPRESIVDLHLLASDLDYYAGAVHDYQEQAFQDVEDDLELGRGTLTDPYGEDGDSFGRIWIMRGAPKMNVNGTLKRGPSSRPAKERDVNLVTWNGADDLDNPKNWTKKKRWMTTITMSLFTFISPVSSSMIAPALDSIQKDLKIRSDLAVELAMSVFVLGFALGPLFLGPLSELFGRKVVLQFSNLFYLIFNLAGGFSTNATEIVAFRFLSGLGGSGPLGIGGGVLADIWTPGERGRAMALYSLMPLLGPAIGPIAGGFIVEYSTWRWIFWSTSIAAAIVQVMGVFFLQETYAAAILTKRKKTLVKITRNQELHTEFDDSSRSFANHVVAALQRPFILLFTQPIVQLLALYIGYVYGVLYLVLASFPRVWAEKYFEKSSIVGLNYISLGLGFFIGTQIAAQFADRIYRKLKTKNSGQGCSEFRVPLMFPGALLVPIGLLLYGWTAQYQAHWIVPNIGTAMFAAGNQLVFQNCQTYLVDAYTRYAASAIAATAVFRSLGGFAFPLFAPYMYNTLDCGWGNSTLAFVGVILGFPPPFILWFWGKTLRKKSTFAAG